MAIVQNGTDKPCDLRWTGDIDADRMHDWVCIKHHGHVYVYGKERGMSAKPTELCPNVKVAA